MIHNEDFSEQPTLEHSNPLIDTALAATAFAASLGTEFVDRYVAEVPEGVRYGLGGVAVAAFVTLAARLNRHRM